MGFKKVEAKKELLRLIRMHRNDKEFIEAFEEFEEQYTEKQKNK